jgi:hypothetical protein
MKYNKLSTDKLRKEKEMNEFIEKNRRLLKFYCITAQTIGWVLIPGGCLWIIFFLSGPRQSGIADNADAILYSISSMLFDFMFPGLIALGLAQFIRYLSESESQQGGILRRGEIIFYMYAGFLIVKIFLSHIWYNHFWYAEIIGNSAFSRLLFLQPFILPTVAKVLILVGLGQILRRILPVIEESKTLV